MNLRLTTIIDMFKSALRISSKRESKNISFFFHLLIFMLQYTCIIWNETFITSFVVFSNRKSRGIFRRDASQKAHFESLKYSAAKLHEKGIILEIGTLPTNQWVISVIYIQVSSSLVSMLKEMGPLQTNYL